MSCDLKYLIDGVVLAVAKRRLAHQKANNRVSDTANVLLHLKVQYIYVKARSSIC